jgi:polysaccharide biosynthesis protein PslG
LGNVVVLGFSPRSKTKQVAVEDTSELLNCQTHECNKLRLIDCWCHIAGCGNDHEAHEDDLSHRGCASLGSWRKLSSVAFSVLLACVCFGCASPNHNSSVEVEASSAFGFAATPLHLKLGLCEDYPKESRTIEQARRDLLLLKTNNIHYLRIAFAWESMEPRRGEFNWSFWDEFVAAANSYGIQLIPYVCYTPEWAASKQTEDFWRSPPKDNAMFAEFMQAIASHYKGRFKTWELWNEPDNPEYWTGTVEQFGEMLRAGSAAVRKTDPNCKVVLGGIAWNLSFLSGLLNQPGMQTNFDIVNLHSYFETWAANPAESLENHVDAAARMLRQFDAAKPLWLAEVGYSNYRSNDYVSPSYNAHFDYEHRPQFQAATVFRLLVPVLAAGKVDLAAWYRIHDLPGQQQIIGDVNNRRLGVLDLQNSPKPALSALRFFNELFGKGVTSADERVRVETQIATDAEVHAFCRSDKALIVVAWLKVVTPHTELASGSDQRIEQIKLRLPGRMTRGERYGSVGQNIGAVRVHESTADLQLTGGNVQVIVFR